MTIQEGQEAPDFSLYTHDAQPFRLADHRGENVVLLFFPGAFTSVCTDELNRVNDDLNDGFEGAQVVGISTDAPAVLNKFREAHQLRYPLLSDHNAEVSARYGAKFSREEHNLDFERMAKRAAFVIDREGAVRYVEVLDDPRQQPNFDAIKETLRNLGRAL